MIACIVKQEDSFLSLLPLYQGSRDDLSVGGGLAGGVIPVTRHGNSVDASFSKEVLNSITGSGVFDVLASSGVSIPSIYIKKCVNEDIDADTPPLPSLPTSAFSSLAVATGNQADSRGSLISVDSNPSNSDRNSEKMDGCEKVREEKGKTAVANML